MKQFWITFFGSIVGVIVGAILTVVLLVFLVGALITSAVQSADQASDTLPAGPMVLELDLRETRLDQPALSPFAFADPLSTVEIVAALQRAEADDRVQGVFLRANEFGMAPGQAEEIRIAMQDFRDSGKFVVAHSQDFFGAGVINYFAVGASDALWLQPTGSFSAVGLSSETLFLGGFFEEIGAEPEFVQFYEYKNAADVYTESGFTEAHSEAVNAYLTSIFDSTSGALAADRGMDEAALRETLVSGPYSAEEAEQAGLVDRLGQVAEARQDALERAGGGDARVVEIETYARARQPGRRGGGATIALIEGQGPIATGEAEPGFGGGEVIGSDSMAAAIDEAAANDEVRAIVVRLDTPGGSATASDQIWDSIIRAQDAGKPVVVSMATVSASGGYYIAAPADRIYAHETTLTGSIGVLGGKIAIDGALNRIGLNLEAASVGGDYATALAASQTWTEDQRAAFTRLMEDTYEDFTGKVADGRGLPLAQVQEIARGRVWTGAQALDRGLVDRIGGLRDAVEGAAELAGVDEDEAVTLRRFPRRPSPVEALQALFGMSAEGAEAAAKLNLLMESPEIRALIEARQASRGGARTYEPARPPR